MAKRWNESYSMVRPEPFAHRIAYDASYNAEYEGWAEVSTVEGAAAWMVCKHSYDSNNNMTKTEWADNAAFSQIWTNYASLTYA